MNATVSKKINLYGQSQVASQVDTASAHRLISMLYEGALVSIANASLHLASGDVPARGAAVSRAIAIIDEGLKASVDLKAGGEIGRNLVALYEYMCYRLLNANLNGSQEGLDEVSALLRDIKNTWDAIGGVNSAKPKFIETEPPKVSASYGKA